MYCRDREVLVSRCCSRLVIALKKPSCTVGEADGAVDVVLLFFEGVVEVAVLFRLDGAGEDTTLG